MSIADNIKLIREKFNLTQDELGAIAGVSGGAVSTWERGTAEPRMGAVQRISDRLNISKADIVGDYSRPLPSNIMVPAGRQIPILGTICAGNGIYCEENFEGYFFVDRSIKADYCLRVKGDSMIDANIYDGDVAFIRKDFDFIDGEIYAVCYGVEESASLKKLYKAADKIMLQPCNSDYAAAFVDVDDVVIVGECIGTYHAR